MAVERKRQLKPGPAGKTAERAHYIRLMKQGFNNSESLPDRRSRAENRIALA